MSVPSSTAWIQYVLSSVPQTLAVSFVFADASDLLVLRTRSEVPTPLVLNSDYSVSGGSGSTGTVVMIAGGANAVAIADVITVTRRVPLTQLAAFANGGPFTPTMIARALDKLTEIAQQLNLVGARSLQFGADENTSGVLPLVDRKSSFLAFDPNGDVAFVSSASIIETVEAPLAVLNVATLRLLPVAGVPNNTPVQVEGYYTAADGGGGVYVWNSASTATDDGGRVIASTGVVTGRWLLRTNGSVSVKQYGCKGDGSAVDTSHLQKALDAAGLIFVPPGVYSAEGLTLSGGTVLVGVPNASIIAGVNGDTYVMAINPGTQGSTNPADNTFGVEIHGITIQGTSYLGFLNGIHNLIVSAASRVLIENCSFTSFRADGIYLGCYVAATQRHNENVTIRDCFFDGVDRNNRNAITVLDCTGLLIDNCKITRCTSPGEPGAIDIEPDAAAYVRIRDITIQNCEIWDIGTDGGNQAGIALAMPTIKQSDLTIPVTNIQLIGNSIRLVDKPIGLSMSWDNVTDANNKPMNATIARNRLAPNSDVNAAALQFGGIKGLNVVGNTIYQSPNPVTFAATCANVFYVENFHNASEITIEKLYNSIFARNQFYNPGNNTWVFLFSAAGHSKNIAIDGNIVIGSGWTYIVKDGGSHVFESGSINKFVGNIYDFGSLANDFTKYTNGTIAHASKAWAPGLIADEGTASTTIATFVGLDPSKHVAVASFPLPFAAWLISATILDGVTVNVTILNKSGSPDTLGSATLNISIIEH